MHAEFSEKLTLLSLNVSFSENFAYVLNEQTKSFQQKMKS